MALKRSTKLRNKLLDSNSYKGLLDQGLLIIYSGTQPSSPDDPIGADDKALMKVTIGAAAYDPATTGLVLASAASSGMITKKDGDNWQGTGIVDGQMGYFRFYSNVDSEAATVDSNTSDSDGTTADYDTVTVDTICMEGTCGLTGDLRMVTNAVEAGETQTIGKFKLSLPVRNT